MKKTILTLLVALSTTVFSQEAPKFLEGFKYTKETGVTDSFDEFEFFQVSDKEQFKSLKRIVNKNGKHKRVWIEKNGLLVTTRDVDGWVVMTFRGFDFYRVAVFQE